jgi:formate hydrogenlyase transcriptional activator
MAKSIALSARTFRASLGLSSHAWTELVSKFLLIAAAYYTGAVLSFTFRVPSTHSSIIWAPNAVLLTAFLFTPVNKWWLWILAALPAHLVAQARDQASVWLLLCPFLANVMQASTAALVLRHLKAAPCRLNTLRGMVIFILVAVIAAPALVSFSAAWLFVLAGWETNYRLVAQARFLNNVVTGFAVAPLLFAIAAGRLDELRRIPRRTYYELSALLAGLIGVLAVISTYPEPELKDLPLELYGPVPFLIWAAVRYRPAGVSFTLLVVASHSLYQTINLRGAFVQGSPVQNLFALEISLAVLALPLMLLSSLIEEGREKSKALAESEARFRTMADTAPVLMWMSGPDKLCHFFNKGWLYFTGRTIDQERGRGWVQGIHIEDRERCLQIQENAFATWEPFILEYRLRRHDGEYRWILDHGVPRFATDGTFLGYIGSAMDFTERKNAESRLNVQNAVTRTLSEATSIAEASPQILRSVCECLGWKLGELWLVQRQANIMTYENGWHSSSRGLEEFLRVTPRLTFSPGAGLQGRVWKTQRPQWIRNLLDDDNFPRRSLATRTGLRSACGFPILLGEEVLGAMVFIGQDVREPDQELLEMMTGVGSQIGQFIDRKRAEEALRASEQQLAQARASSLVMVTQSDLNGRWLQVPASLCRLLGYTEAELVGHFFAEVTHPADVEPHMRQRGRLLRGEIKSFDLEKRYIRKDGGIVWVYVNVSAVTDAGGTALYCLTYINDITERKRAEQALRENELRLRLAMDAARIGYWELEFETGAVIRCERMDRVFGLGPQGLPGNRDAFYALVHPDDREELKSRVAQAMDDLSAYDVEYRIVRPDGTVRWIASRGQALPDADGRPLRIVGLATDVTEHKQSEEALRVTLAELQKLRDRVEAENVYLRNEVARTHRYGKIIGQSERMQKVLGLIDQVAPTDVTVLILGETGSGKEVVARAVHGKSARMDRPLVTVNCSALPAELIESELFGHEKGAFTGAVARQIGRFELADGGTIFLDEVGELPLNLQAKLLRVLQEGEFERLGSGTTIKVNVRVIAATNRDLSEAKQNGSFRADLYYRLNVYPISLPALRERKEDIVHLATAFLRDASLKLGKRFERLPAGVVIALESYDWPGNVRELQNVIERAAVISTDHVLRLPEDWQARSAGTNIKASLLLTQPAAGEGDVQNISLLELERRHVLSVLGATHWKVEGVGGAAEILGLQPNTLRSRMKKLGIPTKKDRNRVRNPANRPVFRDI